MSLRVVKPVVFVLCLAPLVFLVWWALHGELSANPLDDIADQTGRWTLKFLFLTLAITPLRQITGWSFLVKFRRMFGLFAFFYSFLHLATYIVFVQFFNVSEILKDIVKRPFITAGMTAFVLMIPLAVTSTKKWIIRLGGKRWQRLHRLIYVTAVAGVLHFFWLVKLDISWPLVYAAILTVLLGFRIIHHLRIRTARSFKPAITGNRIT
jgi:methionine sulfoxide reductase heme-binding subunit